MLCSYKHIAGREKRHSAGGNRFLFLFFGQMGGVLCLNVILSRVPKLFKINIYEVGTPTVLFDSILQINIVKIDDLQAHNT